MGAAKRRGTYEQRKEAAIARQKVEAEQKRAERARIEASKTPEQKREEYQAKVELLTLLGMWGLMGRPFKYHK